MFTFFLQNLDLDDDLNLNDNELKNLLDEAYSYKGPKDKENKSEIFKVCCILFVRFFRVSIKKLLKM